MSNPFLNELQTVLQQLGGPVNSSHSQAGSWAEDSVGSWDGPVDAGSQTGGIVSQVPSAMSNALDVFIGVSAEDKQATVSCLEHQLMGVLLSWWRMLATDLPLTRSWCGSASKCDVTVAGFPFGLGASKGMSSFASAWQEWSQPHILTGMLEQSGPSVLILIAAWRMLERCPCSLAP